MADGLFADYGLRVELVESAPGAERVRQLASGAGDFLLTASLYYLQALTQDGALPVRFVSVVHQRSSVAVLVREDSDLFAAADVEGCRLAGPPDGVGLGWLVAECCEGLARLGVGQPERVELDYAQAVVALGEGTVDAIADLAERAPLVARRAGVPLRAIPVGGAAYLSGVAAGDWVPSHLVARMCSAVAVTLERQRHEPQRGLGELVSDHPAVDREEALASWLLLEPFVFVDDGPGGMGERRWAETVRCAAAVHGTAAFAASRMVRSCGSSPSRSQQRRPRKVRRQAANVSAAGPTVMCPGCER